MVKGKGEMHMLKRTTGQAPSQGKRLLQTLLWALIWTIGASLVVAMLIDREMLPMEKVGYGSMGILLICGYLLAKKSGAGKGRGQLIGTAASVGIYYLLLLLANGTFFGGEFRGFGVTLSVLLIGAILGSLSPWARRGASAGRRYKIPRK